MKLKNLAKPIFEWARKASSGKRYREAMFYGEHVHVKIFPCMYLRVRDMKPSILKRLLLKIPFSHARRVDVFMMPIRPIEYITLNVIVETA